MSMGNRNGFQSCLKQKKDELLKSDRKSSTSNNLNSTSGLLKSKTDSCDLIVEHAQDLEHSAINDDESDKETQDETRVYSVNKMTGMQKCVIADDADSLCTRKAEQTVGIVHEPQKELQAQYPFTTAFPNSDSTKDRLKDNIICSDTVAIDKEDDQLNKRNDKKVKGLSQSERRLAFQQASLDIKDESDKIIPITENSHKDDISDKFVLTDNSTRKDKSADVVPSDIDRLSALLSELKGDGHIYNEILGKIHTIVKRQCTSKQHHLAALALINEGILNKMDTYLHCYSINSFIELKTNDEPSRKAWPAIKKILTISWIVCDRNVNFCQYVLESKSFLFLLSELRSLSAVNYESSDMYLFIIKAILGILHNISRHVPNSKWNLRNEGLVTVLRTFLPSVVPMIRLKTLIILSFILSEAENEIINSDDDNFVFIFQVLSDALKSDDYRSKKYGMSSSEVLRGINNLAINDENKIRIVRNGALPLYETILASEGFVEEKKLTIMTLWSLAFHHYNKRKMREMPGIMEKLYELRQCEDDELCHAARGTFWELENTSKSVIGKNFSSSAEKDPNQPHIMISYQWDSQPTMIKVKDRLRHAGYKVWMDVEHMTGSTLEAMALAVEKAAVVLICMSQKYKDSPNCRTEAEYVYRLRKDFVPLRLQCEYAPDGWLGILVGTRLYFDMYSEETLDSQLPKLVKELRDRGRVSPSSDTPDIGSMFPRRMISREAVPLLHMSESIEVKDWDTQNILEWLTSLGMEDIYERLYGIDGSLLMEMQKIQKMAPEFFYTMLRDELKLTTVTILKFSKAIRCLR